MSQLPFLLGPYTQVPGFPQRAHHSPTTMMLASLQKDDSTLQAVPLAQGPTEAIGGPSGNSVLPVGLPREPPVPCHIADLSLPAGTSIKFVPSVDWAIQIPQISTIMVRRSITCCFASLLHSICNMLNKVINIPSMSWTDLYPSLILIYLTFNY